jgi:outer membrane protease
MSFDGDGIGVGISGNSDSYEVSIAAGFHMNYNARVIIGVTYDKQTDEVYASAGVGVSF